MRYARLCQGMKTESVLIQKLTTYTIATIACTAACTVCKPWNCAMVANDLSFLSVSFLVTMSPKLPEHSQCGCKLVCLSAPHLLHLRSCRWNDSK